MGSWPNTTSSGENWERAQESVVILLLNPVAVNGTDVLTAYAFISHAAFIRGV
jgi:hypothetical protein